MPVKTGVRLEFPDFSGVKVTGVPELPVPRTPVPRTRKIKPESGKNVVVSVERFGLKLFDLGHAYSLSSTRLFQASTVASLSRT